MKRIGIAVLVAIAAVAMTPVVSGAEIEPIKNFEVVTDLPSTMYAGSTYEAHYRFDSIADEPVPVLMLLSIEGPDIELNEWSVSATLNGDSIDVSENIDNAGNFILSYEVGAKSANEVTIQVSSLPNVLPAAYTFTMELWSKTVWVAVPDFSMSVSPTSGSAVQGGSVTATVSINSIAGFGETVSLSASGLPSGATAGFSPSSGTPSFTSTLTISTASTTPTGTYSITIKGTDDGKTHSCTYTLTVTAAVPIPPEIIQVESPPVHIPEITPGIPQDISIENTNIIGMTINVSESVENVQIIVQQLTERPPTIEIAVPGITYMHFNIVVENMSDAQIENVIINFKVEKSWITQNTIDISAITLNRYDPVAGEWTSLLATYLSEDDTYVYFSAVSPGLSVFAVSGTTVVPPADFEVSDLSISPEEAEPGETVTVSAKVTNVGGQSGSYEVKFHVEGTLEDTKTVTLSPDGSTTVTFTTSREAEGTYTVKVDGLTGSFEVKKPAVFPWPAVLVIIIAIVIVAICYWKREEISRRLRRV